MYEKPSKLNPSGVGSVGSVLVLSLALGGCAAEKGPDRAARLEARLTLAGSALLGMENLSDWSSSQAQLTLDQQVKTEGIASLAIAASGWTEIKSRTFAASSVAEVTETLNVDVYVPAQQPNPWWVGALGGRLNCPAAGVYSADLGQVDLTSLPRGAFSEVELSVPAPAVAALNSGEADCDLTLTLNVNWGSGTWRLDGLDFQSAAPEQDDRVLVDGFEKEPTRLVMAPAKYAPSIWRYVTSDPGSGWEAESFVDGSWAVGNAGFIYGSAVEEDAVGTVWPVDPGEAWFRRTFTISSASQAQALQLYGRWDDSVMVYINGVEAAHEPAWTHGYHYIGISAAARAALHVGGQNSIAVHMENAIGGAYMDLGLVEDAELNDRPETPETGYVSTPALQQYSDAVREFMVEHGIPSGVLAVMKKDQVVVSKGFGWKDKQRTTPLSNDAIMRLASIDKLIGMACIRRLIDEGATVDGQALSYHDLKVFPFLVTQGLTPIPGTAVDSRMSDITVRQLLDHRSGLKNLPDPQEFYAFTGTSAGQTTKMDNMRYVYSAGLEFDPGSEVRYSSVGYFVLRYLVEVFARTDIETFLHTDLLVPVGTTDMIVVRERLADRDPSEPWYATLEAPYDRWIYLDDFLALSSSAEAGVRFLRGYSMYEGEPLIDPDTGAWSPMSTNGYGSAFGGMAGTWSMYGQRRWDEVNFAVIFNMAGSWVYPGTDQEALEAEMMAITDSLSESDWGL